MKIQFQIFPCVFIDIILCDVVSPKTQKKRACNRERERDRKRSQLTNKNIDIIVDLERVPLNDEGEEEEEEMLMYFILI